jgi:hypothetical protein
MERETMQDSQIATILPFPANLLCQGNVSAANDLAQLAKNLTALATGLREYKAVIEDLALVLHDRMEVGE